MKSQLCRTTIFPKYPVLWIDKQSVDQFDGYHFMDLRCIIAGPFHVTGYHFVEKIPIQIRPVDRSSVQQDLAHIIRQLISVPDSEMVKFMSAQEQSFDMKRPKKAIQFGNPLRHPVVVCVLRLEGKFLEYWGTR